MAILGIQTEFAGEVSVQPRIVRIICNNTLAEVTAQNFLKSTAYSGYQFYPNDLFAISYANSESRFFVATVDGANITLTPITQKIETPTTQDHIAVYKDTAGSLGQDATIAKNNGSIQAGQSGVFGSFLAYPTDAGSGYLQILALNNSGDFATTIYNRPLAQNSSFAICDPGQSQTNFMLCNLSNGVDPGANLVSFDVLVGVGPLASGGSVTLYPSSGAKRYKIRALFLNGFGTNFSAGGGDRNAIVTDGTNTFSTIPAATLQSLANDTWGGANLQYPASIPLNTSTVAGQPLVVKYSGGTTDYGLGVMTISGILERVQ